MTVDVIVVKLRLKLSAEDIHTLDGQSRICNWLYNNLLEEANEYLQQFIETQDQEVGKVLYSKYGLRNLVPIFKQEHKFLNVVHSSPLKNTALRLTKAITDYQSSKKGKLKGKKRGWPKFKSWRNNWFSLLYDEPNKGFKVVDNKLQLSLGMGADKSDRKLTLELENSKALKNKKIKNCRICKEGSYYYAAFNVEYKVTNKKPIKKIIAFDPNHKNLLYGVETHGNAVEVASPKWLKKYDKRIDELKSKRDKCKKKSYLVDILDSNGLPTGKQRWQPSRRWLKLNEVLQKVYDKRREQIKTYCYTLANRLCKKYDYIGIGDYTPNGGGITKKMRRAINNRSVIGKFKLILSWVATKSGKYMFEFDERGTTRTCHRCQHIVKDGIPPDVRQWHCTQCNSLHIRDENAAQNGLVKTMSQVPGSGPVLPTTSRWAWNVVPRGVVTTNRGHNYSSTVNSKKLNGKCGNFPPKHNHTYLAA